MKNKTVLYLQKNGMIIYNTTFIVDEKIHDSWFSWLQKEHINDYLKSSCFLGSRLGKITSHVEPGLISYSLQFFVNDQLTLDNFKKNFLVDIQQKSLERYGTSVLAFSTEMEHVGDFNN